MKKVTAEAIKHTDVRGKEIYYLKLTDGTTETLINVGLKTYETVSAMMKQTEIKFDETKKFEELPKKESK